MSQRTINLADFRTGQGRVFTGRDYGQQLRKKLDLNLEDKTPDSEVTIQVPDDTLSLNSSFFLGVFGQSVRRLGREGFQKKYLFTCTERVRTNINTGIRRALLTKTAIEEFGET